jgi:NAD(P)H-hydrate epimerase
VHRDPDSHKGENGKVAVIGGSRTQHGAPLFSALAAEASGVDLVYVCLPARHEEVAKTQSLNFQVHPFDGDDLTKRDLDAIVQLLATMDACVIGPGLSRTPGTLKILRELVDECPCRMILDATALQPWTLEAVRGRDAILTPHLGELERMGVALDQLGERASEAGATIVFKASVVRIAGHDGRMHEATGGNAGLTHGGTGDALAGLIAGLLAQRVPGIGAASMAATIIKRAATILFETHGYAYTTRDIIKQIPHLLRGTVEQV